MNTDCPEYADCQIRLHNPKKCARCVGPVGVTPGPPIPLWQGDGMARVDREELFPNRWNFKPDTPFIHAMEISPEMPEGSATYDPRTETITVSPDHWVQVFKELQESYPDIQMVHVPAEVGTVEMAPSRTTAQPALRRKW